MAPVVTIGGRKVFVVPELPIMKPHKPIEIHGNSEFTHANGVVSGDGTMGNHYIIENWNIDTIGAIGIGVENTSAYFIIRDCDIHSRVNKRDGIMFKNVTHGKIDNVSSHDNYFGIYIRDKSLDNIISGCRVYNNSQSGIFVENSDNNTVDKSDIYDNKNHGVVANRSTHIWVHYNNIYKNGETGIRNWSLEKDYEIGAINNWWGDVSGPSEKGKGVGDKVSENVIFKPWLKDKR